MERLLGTDRPSLVSAHEAEIENLEAKKVAASERINAKADGGTGFKDTYRTACALLASAWKLKKNHSFSGGTCFASCSQSPSPTAGMRGAEPLK